MDIDMCSIGTSATEDDEHFMCGITVNGSGNVYTELEIYYGSRGGYIKVEDKTGRFVRTVSGNCEATQQDEEWTMIPNESRASVFNGAELSMLTNRMPRKGIYTATDEAGNTTVVEILRKIR